MKVAIDIRRISDFGVGTYIRNVVRTLARIDLTDEFFLIGQPEQIHEIGDLPPNFQPIVFSGPEISFRNYFEFRRTVKRLGCDLVHIPHTFWVPTPAHCPYVMTVHDLLDYMYRVKMDSSFRRTVHFYMTRQALSRADRLFAVSNFTKKDIVRLFNVPEQRIEVVYNAIDDRFRRGHVTQEEKNIIVERYQVNHPFLLYAGRISPHKNVVRIIEAFAALKAELAKDELYPDLKLIIIGDEVSKHPDLRRAVIRGGMQNDVRFLGFVAIDVLRIFYDVAKIFVFPSLYEGFGLPPLEAMAHGTPVVTSNTSSLPEVVGKAAVMVNPENIFEIRNALYRVLVDQPFREKLKAAGVQQAQQFSWDNSVRRILDVYREVAAQKAVVA